MARTVVGQTFRGQPPRRQKPMSSPEKTREMRKRRLKPSIPASRGPRPKRLKFV